MNNTIAIDNKPTLGYYMVIWRFCMIPKEGEKRQDQILKTSTNIPSIAVSEKGARVESATGAGVNDMFHMPDEGLKGTDLISVKPSQKSLALQEIIASLHAASDIKEVMQHIHDGMFLPPPFSQWIRQG